MAATGAILASRAVLQASASAAAFPRILPANTQATRGAARVTRSGSYRITVVVRPNSSTALNRISVRLTRNGRPVAGARVTIKIRMSEMSMPAILGRLRETSHGRYVTRDAVLGMEGRWNLRITVAPPRAEPFSIRLVDRVSA
ncbi:MAG TPA: FixH family protein [Gaiellaceae bacterium]|nr:FixH family protein [Gaiellaceae bacterium]